VREGHAFSIGEFIYCRGNPVRLAVEILPSRGIDRRQPQKNKGAGVAPESRKYLEMSELEKRSYFFPFLVPFFFAAFFFLAGMDSVTPSLGRFR
jgi:hypothetical protein